MSDFMPSQASPGPTVGQTPDDVGEDLDTPFVGLVSRPRMLRRILHDRVALGAVVLLALVGGVGLLASVVAPFDPLDQNLQNTLAMPSAEHWLGTDNLGRDVVSRLIFGTRISVQAVLIAVGVALVVGVPIGLVSGYVGRWLDVALMRLTDAFMALPNIILVIAIIAVLGNTLTNAMVALGLVFAPTFIRLVRGEVLAVREHLYVQAARVLGLRGFTIVLRHVLPNILSPIIVQTSIMMGYALILEAGLSFIGLGVQPPDASWGAMLATASQFIDRHPFLIVPPGITITSTVLALNLVGDGIRDAMSRRLDTAARKGSFPHLSTAIGKLTPALGSQEGDILLSVSDLRVEFPGPDGKWRPVVDGVDVAIRRGEVLGIVGESGSGKSMTALAIMRLIPPPGVLVGGSIRFNGRELINLSPREMRALRGREVALISQDPMSSLNPAFSIGNQMVEAILCHTAISRREAQKRAVELLEQVGIVDAAKRLRDYPHEFSGGMAQRVMIAMALSCKPKLLIADEPTTALDVTVQAEILELLRRLQQENELSVIFVSHDLGVIAEICDRIAVMYAGQVVEVGSADDIFTRPQHPYTEGLLQSLPQMAIERGQMHIMLGSVPSVNALPPGCRFAPRCGHAHTVCTLSPPLGPTSEYPNRVRCVRANEIKLEGV